MKYEFTAEASTEILLWEFSIVPAAAFLLLVSASLASVSAPSLSV